MSVFWMNANKIVEMAIVSYPYIIAQKHNRLLILLKSI